LGMSALHFLGDSRGCFADDRELLNDGAANQLRPEKPLKIAFRNECADNECADVVHRLNDVI
jgi:hypothetical protein